jgi:hypothetical protein
MGNCRDSPLMYKLKLLADLQILPTLPQRFHGWRTLPSFPIFQPSGGKCPHIPARFDSNRQRRIVSFMTGSVPTTIFGFSKWIMPQASQAHRCLTSPSGIRSVTLPPYCAQKFRTVSFALYRNSFYSLSCEKNEQQENRNSIAIVYNFLCRISICLERIKGYPNRRKAIWM